MPNLKPAKSFGGKPDIPEEVQVGDFIVGKFIKSDWSRYFPWEEWDHAAMVTKIDPLTIIESSGIILQKKEKKHGKKEIREGVVEHEFLKPRTVTNLDGTKNPDGNLWLKNDLTTMLWLRPVFPNPLRKMTHWIIPRRMRKTITETQARNRAVVYARKQLGEPHSIWVSKWNTKKWYCSLLIFKSYSRTVTDMYLESYEPRSGTHVTPEDLVKSKRSEVYHEWFNNSPS